MRANKIIQVLVITIFIFFCNRSNASHIFGGELLYQHISGNTYEIQLIIYGDCSGNSFPNLVTSVPEIRIFNGNTVQQNITLVQASNSNIEVTPVCPDKIDSTACKLPSSTIPGIKQFTFTRRVILQPSANWRIVFEGALGTSGAGRTNAITNIVVPPPTSSGSLMYLEATLNNLNGPNSSPQYTTIPTPFYCINVEQEYNQGATDADNDSLHFSLTSALEGRNINARYISPYTAQQPIAVAANAFNYNNINGQMTFTPNLVQNALVVNKVEEYKDGVLVGSSMREMTFIVLNNCNNKPPTGLLDTSTVTGARVDFADKNQVNVCIGDNVSFKVPVTDGDSDNVNVTLNSIPAGANAFVLYNNTDTPLINFDWQTQSLPVGTYNFFANYQDDACPLSASQTQAYTIRVVNPYAVSHTVLAPSNCYHQVYVKLNVTNGVIPRIITLKDTNDNILNTYYDSTGEGFTDSLKVGTYNIRVTSNHLLCGTDYQFTLVNSGIYPIKPFVNDTDLCLNDEPSELKLVYPLDGTIEWYTNDGTLISGPPTYSTNSPAVLRWRLRQKYDACFSDFDTVTVVVHDLPNIEIQNQPQRVCIGDGMTLRATGGIDYTWMPESEVIQVDSMPYTRVNQPTLYTVEGVDEFGCINYDSVLYDDIENCCRFSYPSAFTPNGDGTNDGWRVLNYGNVEYFRVSIFNRWGQRVFLSSDPYKHWDGNYFGKKCEVGTYYFNVKGKCVSGGEEEYKGTIQLIR